MFFHNEHYHAEVNSVSLRTQDRVRKKGCTLGRSIGETEPKEIQYQS